MAGGQEKNIDMTRLASTEIYQDGRWREVGPLPAAVYDLKGVTVDNTVFMTGVIILIDRDDFCKIVRFRRLGCLPGGPKQL